MKEKLDEKLALKEKVDKSYEQMLKIARAGVLKFGKTSIPYLMRKLKCSYSMAKRIVKDISSDNDCDVILNESFNDKVFLWNSSQKNCELKNSFGDMPKFKRSSLILND